MSLRQAKNFIRIIGDTNQSPQIRYDHLKAFLHYRGYGDKNQEIVFFKEYFSYFFSNQHDIFQIEWQQFQDYNDNYLYYDIHRLLINQYLEIEFGGFDCSDQRFWEYKFNQPAEKGAEIKDWSVFYRNLQKKCEYLREPINQVLIFLKSLYDFYGRYYFIYVFGRRARVEITRKGILIDQENIDYEDAEEYDKKLIL